MNFTEEYQVRKDRFEDELKKFCDGLSFPEPLRSAVCYSLLGDGKRLRPILFGETVRMFGGDMDSPSMNFALAIECIHTYSLIHDDLPCMDNDDFRRGRPTCHKKFGEANAVLAGDALLNLSYELILKAIAESGGDEAYRKAGEVIAAAAGGNGLVGGQVKDLSGEVSAQTIDYIYDNKTGALIKAALVAGAYIGNATQYEIEAIAEYGRLFGYGFQLRDDLLDMEEEKEKNTFAGFYGREKTEKVLREKSEEAILILGKLKNSEFLSALTTNFIIRTK